MIAYIRRLVASIYVWALCREAESEGRDLEDARRIFRREVDAVPESYAYHRAYQDGEQAILEERLSRRYDLGMALNEAAQRAIADKAVAREAPKLSANQLKALEFQKDYLKRLVDRA